MIYIAKDDKSLYLKHHGILGQKWGKQNGPPYPLSAGDHSKAEIKEGYKKSIGGDTNPELYDRKRKKVKAKNEKLKKKIKDLERKGNEIIDTTVKETKEVVKDTANTVSSEVKDIFSKKAIKDTANTVSSEIKDIFKKKSNDIDPNTKKKGEDFIKETINKDNTTNKDKYIDETYKKDKGLGLDKYDIRSKKVNKNGSVSLDLTNGLIPKYEKIKKVEDNIDKIKEAAIDKIISEYDDHYLKDWTGMSKSELKNALNKEDVNVYVWDGGLANVSFSPDFMYGHGLDIDFDINTDMDYKDYIRKSYLSING